MTLRKVGVNFLFVPNDSHLYFDASLRAHFLDCFS